MNCKDCRYRIADNQYSMCEITHIINPKSCDYIANDNLVESMNICYNCKYWMGFGDWGLSCKKNYYNCSSNGFDKACEQYERM